MGGQEHADKMAAKQLPGSLLHQTQSAEANSDEIVSQLVRWLPLRRVKEVSKADFAGNPVVDFRLLVASTALDQGSDGM